MPAEHNWVFFTLGGDFDPAESQNNLQKSKQLFKRFGEFLWNDLTPPIASARNPSSFASSICISMKKRQKQQLSVEPPGLEPVKGDAPNGSGPKLLTLRFFPRLVPFNDRALSLPNWLLCSLRWKKCVEK